MNDFLQRENLFGPSITEEKGPKHFVQADECHLELLNILNLLHFLIHLQSALQFLSTLHSLDISHCLSIVHFLDYLPFLAVICLLHFRSKDVNFCFVAFQCFMNGLCFLLMKKGTHQSNDRAQSLAMENAHRHSQRKCSEAFSGEPSYVLFSTPRAEENHLLEISFN